MLRSTISASIKCQLRNQDERPGRSLHRRPQFVDRRYRITMRHHPEEIFFFGEAIIHRVLIGSTVGRKDVSGNSHPMTGLTARSINNSKVIRRGGMHWQIEDMEIASTAFSRYQMPAFFRLFKSVIKLDQTPSLRPQTSTRSNKTTPWGAGLALLQRWT